ncbi:AraC family transcriptional regulator [bacterium]|nr:AraC family transcriptional regulator [bacterium]
MQLDALQVLKRIMAAHNINTMRVTPPFEGLENFDYGLRQALDPQFDWQGFGNLLLECVPENTLVFAEGTFELHFAMFHVPDEENTVFLIGPWTTGPRSEEQKEWTLRMIGPEGAAAVQDYYNGVRIVQDNGFAATINAVVSMLFPAEEFQLVEQKEFLPLNFHPDMRYFNEPPFQQEIPVAMLEARYEMEGRILDAVSRGDADAAMAACHQMGRFTYGGRFTGSPYQVKNKMVIMNTLLRKAIERSKVHPYYIDKISARYSLQIENMAMEDERKLLYDMVREYCAYVRRYSLRDYSPVVQKVINHINLNLGSQLSLKSLASMCFISPSYLSNLFKQETGTTLIDYINTQRIGRAAQILSYTDKSVAAVAEQVGILDVNYFTKMFKKSTGTTPTQYRREHRKK